MESDTQQRLLPSTPADQATGSVECLVATFERNVVRRQYFAAILSEKLKDTVFRKIEGFPIGKRESKQTRLKIVLLEAVRTSFKKAWQKRDYATIIEAAKKIPENVRQEDQKLLMWYDHARTRTEVDPNGKD